MSGRHVSALIATMLGLVGILRADPTAHEDEITTWSVVGDDKDQLQREGGTWVLASGAQIFRTIIGDRVSLQIESKPLFGTTAGELPVIELGDAALTFLRTESGGALVLVLGENPAIRLPFTVPLAEDGRSEQPLRITLSRLGETVVVSAHDRAFQFPGGLVVIAQEIVLSAGSLGSWPIQGLTVISEPQKLTKEADTKPNDKMAEYGRTLKARNRAVETPVKSASVGFIAEVESTSLQTDSKSDVHARRGGLEVFTPSAVRRGRIDQVRRAAVETVQGGKQ